MKKTPLLFKSLLFLLFLSMTVAGFAQKIQITGTVTDEKGEPLPSASVVIEGTTKGGITDSEGKFILKDAPPTAKLVVSFVGFDAQIIDVNNRTVIDVIMVEGKTLQEVEIVDIGYGSAKRSDLTGAVAQIKTKTIEESGYSNFQQAIAGKVAGVVVSETSGQPGSGLSIEIRGTSSLNFSTQPLYVVDGIPLENPNVGSLNTNANASGAGPSSPLSAINPNDIQSMEILKDASATAIYGSRGANGVVLITTKSGQKGKPRLSLNMSAGLISPLKKLELLTSQEYAQLTVEARKFRFLIDPVTYRDSIPTYLPEEIPNLPYYDHQSDIGGRGLSQNVNVSLSGGDAKSRYYMSGEYSSNGGLIKSTNHNRYNFSLRYENDINSRLRVNTNLTLTRTVTQGTIVNSFVGGVLLNALRWAPNNPFYDPEGNLNQISIPYHYGTTAYEDPALGTIYYNARFPLTTVLSNITSGQNGSYGPSRNPMNYITGNNGRGVLNDNTNNQIVGSLTATYKITNDLKFTGIFGVTTYSSLLENYIPSTILPANTTVRGVATLGTLQSNKFLYQGQLTYDKKIKKHTFNVVAVGTAEKFVEKRQTTSSQGFVNDLTGANNIQAGQIPQIPISNYDGYQLISSIARGSYNYDGRYYLTLSGRVDGSSKFASDKRFGVFPSIGGSWRVMSEKWFQNAKILRGVSELKLRASYGIIGNQALGSYNTLSTLSTGGVILGTSTTNTAFFPSRFPNRGLSWENTKQANIGLDLGLFKNRIDFEVNVYQKRTDDLLYQVDIPATSGFASYTKNVASLTNEGLELSLSTVNIKTKNWKWSTSANIAFNRNVVNKLAGNSGEFLGVNQLIGNSYLFILQPGEPIGRFYGLKSLPVWNDSTIKTKPATFQPGAREGDRRYADLNGDGLLTNDDRVFIGNALPKFTGGFRTELSYKKLDIAAFFSFSYGNQVFNQLDWTLTNMDGFGNTYKKTYNDRYIYINNSGITDAAEIERIKAHNYQTRTNTAGSTFDLREVTDYFIEDGSFIRCKDINISYTLDSKLVKRMKMSFVKVYFNLQNMFTYTNYSGYNPEVNGGSLATKGLDNGSYPLNKTYRLGLNITF